MKIKTAIIGGSGYGGSELLRILLLHPNTEIKFVTANEQAGKKVCEVHRNLYGITDLEFISAPDNAVEVDDVDVVFFALPHGQALKLIPQLRRGIKAIDLSGDFRLENGDLHNKFYKTEFSGDLQKRFVYGLSETNKDEIKAADLIANPGCFATATLLALSPVIKELGNTGRIIVDAKTGSSGSGIKPAANTHHPQRTNSFYAYKPFSHQHVPEIEQHLKKIGDLHNDLIFMTHSLPVSRGIFVSAYVELTKEYGQEELENIFSEFYKDSYFVRLVKGSPDINWVKNTNFCDISLHVNGKELVVFSAIDNLVKGAAGQAVQNMNLMYALDETTGLVFTGSNP